MERLVQKQRDGLYRLDSDKAFLQEGFKKLYEYEDTGLTPEEIQELQADRDYWKAEALKHCAKLGEIKLLMGRSNG